MNQFLIYGLLLFFLSSCQWKESKKLSSQEIFEEEISTINWNEVDQYPVFEKCEHDLEKEAMRQCFLETLNTQLLKLFPSEYIQALRKMEDSIVIEFEVSKTAGISIVTIEGVRTLTQDFPDLEQRIVTGLDSLRLDEPAYKRGIPVSTRFRLPVIFKSEEGD